MSTVITTTTKKTIIPKNFKSTLPPRKRAKTKEEKEQRRIERIMRNRRAARKSRERKRLHMESMETKLKIYDEIFQVLNIKEKLSVEHPNLLEKLESFENSQTKDDLSGLSDMEVESDGTNVKLLSSTSPNSTTSTSNTLVNSSTINNINATSTESLLSEQAIENEHIEDFLSKIKQEEEEEEEDFSTSSNFIFGTVSDNFSNIVTPPSFSETSSNLQMQWFESMTPPEEFSSSSSPSILNDKNATVSTTNNNTSLDFIRSPPIDWEIMRNPAVLSMITNIKNSQVLVIQ